MQCCWLPQPNFADTYPWGALTTTAPQSCSCWVECLHSYTPTALSHQAWTGSGRAMTLYKVNPNNQSNPWRATRLSANSPTSNWGSYPLLKATLCTMSTCALYRPYCIQPRDDSRHCDPSFCFQDWKTFYYIPALSMVFSLQNIHLWGWGLFQVSQVRGSLVQVRLERKV